MYSDPTGHKSLWKKIRDAVSSAVSTVSAVSDTTRTVTNAVRTVATSAPVRSAVRNVATRTQLGTAIVSNAISKSLHKSVANSCSNKFIGEVNAGLVDELLSGQLLKEYWNYNVNLVRNAGYALADSAPGQYFYYDFAYQFHMISNEEKAEGQVSVIADAWNALEDEAIYIGSSENRMQSFEYGINSELPLSFLKPVTGLIETFDAAYEGEDTATQAIESAYASYDQIMMNAATFQVDERAYNDGKVPADIAGGIAMGILLDNLTSGMSFFSASPLDEIAESAAVATRSEMTVAGDVADDVAGSIVGDAENAVEGGVAGESTQGKGFDSFNDAKKFLGSPGEGNQWHHIVEQSQIQKSGFETQLIQNTDNLIAIDRVTHGQISGYYSSKQAFTEGLTVRNWLSGQSYEEQFEFGIQKLQDFGVTK